MEDVDDAQDEGSKACEETPEEEKACDPASSEEETKEDEPVNEAPATGECKETAPEGAEEAPEEKECGEDEEAEEATKELDTDDEDEPKDKAACPDCGNDPCTCEEDKKKAAEVAEIRSLGELTNQRDLAESFIKENRGLDDFKTELKNLKTNKPEIKENIPTMKNTFNLVDTLRAFETKSGDSFEASNELKRKYNMPTNDNSIAFNFRALSDDDSALRPPEYKEELYTGLLYPESVIGKTNASIVSFNRPQSAIKFAVQLSGATASFVGMNAPVPSGNMGWTEKLYEPHKVGAFVNIPFLSYMEDQPDIAQIVTDDMLKNTYMSIDNAAITGSGTGDAPTGVINDPNVNVVDSSGIYSLTGAMMFEKKIRDSNDFSNDLTWVMCNDDYYKFATTPYSAVEQNRMLLEDGKLLGYKVVICNALTAGTVVLGNFSQLILLNFHPVTLDLDTRGDGAALAQSRRYIIYSAIDVCVRRPKSFTVSKSA